MEFPPGDTFQFMHHNLVCRGDFNLGECFEGEPTGTYLIFSGITDAYIYPWFLNINYVLETGFYYHPIYKSLNRSLSKKIKLYRPTIVNIIN